MLRNGQAYFFHADGLGSVVRITDATGTMVQSYEYSAFGQTVASSGNLDQPYRFTGRERDTETGLNYHRARYYDPAVGRWLSRDALGFAGGDVVLYGYVQGNPVNLTDPSGMIPPVIAAGLYYGGAKLLALGTAWAGFKAVTTTMSKSRAASKSQVCTAQSAANSRLINAAAINAVGAPLVFAPGALVMAASPAYTSAMVATGTPTGQFAQKAFLNYISPDPPSPSLPGYLGGGLRWVTDKLGVTE